MCRLMPTAFLVTVLTIAVLTACSSDTQSTRTSPSDVVSAPAVSPGPSATGTQRSAVQVAGMASSGATSGTRLSANNASRSELAEAFEAAGISNASKWAREVEEYRPYDENDTDYSKLRGELAKYNPAPGVVDSIIELLELP